MTLPARETFCHLCRKHKPTDTMEIRGWRYNAAGVRVNRMVCEACAKAIDKAKEARHAAPPN